MDGLSILSPLQGSGNLGTFTGGSVRTSLHPRLVWLRFCQGCAEVLFHVRHEFYGCGKIRESDRCTGMKTHHDLAVICWNSRVG